VLQAARELIGERARVRALEGVRFRELLLPGQELALELDWDGAHSLQFKLADGARVFSSGRIALR